ncbi:MAG: response regulator, partial [Christensenellaceae bacterium]|nr:response regulator [Christensenellaceae bacterium]
MQEKIKLLIVEDNPYLTSTMKDFFTKREEVDVIATAQNAGEALELMQTSQPTALITDLIMPQSDGFVLLEKLSSGQYGPMPATIVLSALGSETLISRSLDLGVRYYMVKPFDLDLLHKRLLDLFNLRSVTAKVPVATVKSRSLDEKITSIFLSIGIPAHIKGYQFLREGIKVVIRNPGIINNITKELYPSIARH